MTFIYGKVYKCVTEIQSITYCFHRAIDFQALVGNVGGYIGLCLGYNFLQIPGLILVLSRKLKIFHSGKESNPGQG